MGKGRTLQGVGLGGSGGPDRGVQPDQVGSERVLTVLPSAKIATWRYWFRLSRDVYVGNRSFASYTKTKTVESDV